MTPNKHLLILALFMGLVSACGPQNTGTPSPEPTPSVPLASTVASSAIPTVRATASIVPTSTLTPTPTEAPTPGPLPAAMYESYLFSPECSLPCWYGLIPGESTQEESQVLVLEHFQSSATVYEHTETVGAAQFEETTLVWRAPNDHSLAVYLLFAEDILRFIALDWSTSGQKLAPLSLAEAFERVGLPQDIRINIEPAQNVSAFADVALDYKTYTFYFVLDGPISIVEDENGDKIYTTRLCVDTNTQIDQAVIFAPEQSTAAQSYSEFFWVDSYSVEEVFGISVDDFLNQLQQNNDPCFETDFLPQNS